MTSSKERIQLLFQVCSLDEVSKWLGKVSSEDLSTWLISELGSDVILDDFQPHGPLLSKAIAPQNILHIVSGNTPHAAFQSLIRGLLIGSHNVIKTPSSGLPELTDAIPLFPEALRKMIEVHTSLADEHWASANAIIAIGSDASIEAIQARVQPHQTFIAHSHKISIGVVYDQLEDAAPLAARDVSLYNQRGCLSLHAIYVSGDSEVFAHTLAREMAAFAHDYPPEELTKQEAGAIRNLRETIRFQAANDSAVQLWESTDSLDWTVIHDPSPTLKLSCLNRCVYVKPLPAALNTETLGAESRHLSTVALHPFNTSHALMLEHLPATRICPMGTSQEPSIFWHHDGYAPLASLVKWQDIG
ncbi:MAG: acyl-CoA reductase [Akkermansiaceae bacterium]